MGKSAPSGSRHWRAAGLVLVLAMAAGLATGTYVFVSTHSVTTPARASEPDAAALPRARGASGLPLPRFVSLKSGKVRVRRGPSAQYKVAWVYHAKGLPVEITAEFEHWRRIRDAEGAEGWINRTLLSGWRTALVAPWEKKGDFALHQRPDDHSSPVAMVKSGVIAQVSRCTGDWCKLKIGDYEGWLQQPLLWGVYPHERYPAGKTN